MKERTFNDVMSLISAWTKTDNDDEISVIKSCIIETMLEEGNDDERIST
jgi:hypothetical protein